MPVNARSGRPLEMPERLALAEQQLAALTNWITTMTSRYVDLHHLAPTQFDHPSIMKPAPAETVTKEPSAGVEHDAPAEHTTQAPPNALPNASPNAPPPAGVAPNVKASEFDYMNKPAEIAAAENAAKEPAPFTHGEASKPA